MKMERASLHEITERDRQAGGQAGGQAGRKASKLAEKQSNGGLNPTEPSHVHLPETGMKTREYPAVDLDLFLS